MGVYSCLEIKIEEKRETGLKSPPDGCAKNWVPSRVKPLRGAA